MATHLVTHLTFDAPLAPGERLRRVLDALAASDVVDDASWVVRPPFSADLRTRLSARGRGPQLPYDEPLAGNQVRALLDEHPDDIDALAVDALTRLWIYARTHQPEQVEIDLYKTGLTLFREPHKHPAYEVEAARLEAEIAAAEAAHEVWREKQLRAERTALGQTLRSRAIDWFLELLERLATRARPAWLVAGPDATGPTPVSASMAWFEGPEALLGALRGDYSCRRYQRATEKAVRRAFEAEGDGVLRMPPGCLLTNADLDPTGPSVEPFFARVTGR